MDMKNITVTYAHPKLKIENYWERGITGSGVKIGIVDDGIEENPALNLAGGYACGEHTTYLKEHPHAMHCAGIAAAKNLQDGQPAGIAPDAEIYSIRMYYKTYEDRVNSIIEAIEYAVDVGLDILSMSIHLNENSSNQHSEAAHSGTPIHMRIKLREAFYKAYQHGIIIFVAAGNRAFKDVFDSTERLELLPKMPNAVTVANLTMINERRNSSGTGRYVDISGYGSFIKSLSTNGGHAVMSGTSMATPQIAGVYALYLQLFRDTLTPQQILEKLFTNCIKIDGLKDDEQGRGIPMPPEELYNRNVINSAENQFRTWDSYTWRATQVFAKENNKWVEMEAIGYE